MVKGGSGSYVRPGTGYVYLEEDLSNGQVMDVSDRYVVSEPSRRTIRHMQTPIKTLTANGSMISVDPSVISVPRHRQEKIVTRVLPPNPPVQRVREVRRMVQNPVLVQQGGYRSQSPVLVQQGGYRSQSPVLVQQGGYRSQSPVLVQQGGYRTVIDTSRNAIHNSRGIFVSGGSQNVREVVPQRYVQKPQMVSQVVRRSVPKKKIYVTKSRDYGTTSSSSSSSSSDSDEERTVISKGEVVHAVIRDNWSFSKRDPKEEKIVTSARSKKDKDNDDADSSASSSSLESRKLKILEQVRDNGVENGQVIVNDNGTPVIVKMRSNDKKKKDKKSKKEKKKTEGNFLLY